MKNIKKLPILLAACFSTIILAIINSSFGSMLGPITEYYLDGDGASQGYPNSAMQIGCIIAVVALVFFGSRLRLGGKILLLIVSAATMAAGMFILGMAPSFTVFVLIFAVVGLAYGASDVTSSAIVADAYGEKSADMMCLLHGSHGAAGIIAPIIVSAVLAKVGGERWSLPYTLIAVFIIFVIVYLLVLYFGTSKNTNSEPKEEVKANSLVIFDKKLLPIALPILFYGTYLVGMISYTERFEGTLSDPGAKTLTLSLLYVGLTASRLLLPLLHIKPKTYLRVAPIISAVMLLLAVVSGNIVIYVIFASISALVSGAFIPVAISCACEMLPGNTTGASTLMNLSMLIGNGISAPLIGAVSGAFGLSVGMFIPVTALTLAFVCSFLKKD